MYWLQVNGTEPCYDKSTLVQVMAWCHQATSHYLSQCWPRSMSPYEATRPQRVNACNPVDLLHNLWEHNWDINSLVPGRFWWNFRLVIFKFILVIDGWGISSILVKLPSWECQWTLLMISQHWFGQWLGAVRQQAITWANFDPDPWRHVASLGHNELTSQFNIIFAGDLAPIYMTPVQLHMWRYHVNI